MTLPSDTGIEVARWSLRLFGGFDLSRRPGGESITALGKRERVVLALLALSPNCRAPRRKLATLLWGDSGDEAATDNLRVCIFNVRKALGEAGKDAIVSDGRDLVLDRAAFDVDALEFRRLAAGGSRAELEAAANLYSGEFLDGLEIRNDEYESWRREESTRFRDQMIDVLARLMGQLADPGDTDAAVEAGIRLLRLDPLHESAVRRLMRLYGESGRRGAAVQLYRTFADTLKRELGAEPEPETQAILAAISRGVETPRDTPIQVPPEPKAGEPKPQRPETTAASQTVAPMEPLRRVPSGKMRWIGAGALAAAALVLFVLTMPWSGRGPISSSPICIVVLPFANLSGDKGQEYFSDGVTEEIIGALAKVPALCVKARTLPEHPNVEDILGQVNASYALQGSVRRDGDKLRVTAQLVDSSGTTRWSENYDRKFVDIIATQEDVARAVATALRVPLGLKPGQNLFNDRAITAEDYQQFLRAHAVAQMDGRANLVEAIRLLEQIVARNPKYAPAWARLSNNYYSLMASDPARSSGAINEYRRLVDSNMPKIEAGYRRAIELDPNYPGGYFGLAVLELNQGHFLASDELLTKAFALYDPNDPTLLGLRSMALAIRGQMKEAIAIRRQLQAVEPFVPGDNVLTALYLWVDGDNDAALAMFNALPPQSGGGRVELARIYASIGRYSEAADLLEKPPLGNAPDERKEAARLLRLKAAGAPLPGNLKSLGPLDWVYLYTGAPERALDAYEADLEVGRMAIPRLPLVWHASYAPVRKTERFKAYLRRLGLVDYWRAKGWPEFCHPVGADDFACT